MLWTWLALTAAVATASAEPGMDAGLVWRAPASCPDAAELRARIERRLGDDRVAPAAGAASGIDRAMHGVEVEIAPEGAGAGARFVARIDLRAVTVENAIRVLTSARCDELTDAVAVVIARVAAERRVPAELPRRSARVAVAAAPREALRTWGGGVRVMGVSGIGALPGIGIAGELAGYVWARSWFVELSGMRWMQSSSFQAPGASGRVDIRLDLVALRIGWRSARLPLRGWLGGELGTVQGQGGSLDEQIGNGRWAAIASGFGVAWAMTPRARLFGMVELAIPLARARFLQQDGSLVYRPDPAAVRSGLGLELGW